MQYLVECKMPNLLNPVDLLNTILIHNESNPAIHHNKTLSETKTIKQDKSGMLPMADGPLEKEDPLLSSKIQPLSNTLSLSLTHSSQLRQK